MPNTHGSLEPARIYDVDDTGEENHNISIDCEFNPAEYTLSKTNTYKEQARNQGDVPSFEFEKAGPQTLTLKLWFDIMGLADIAQDTKQLWKLMESKTRQVDGETVKVPPPEVAFEWGAFRFLAVITKMTQKYTLFDKDGTPWAAEVDVTFTQHKDTNDYPNQNPTSGGGDIKRVWRVVAGDRLDTISYAVYGDATRWRSIAEYNGLSDPLALNAGRQLVIPAE